ncbi:MAG: endonuclease [Planctomycetota bacterium]|nr:endonuclease [Planctomycetota bacterium]
MAHMGMLTVLLQWHVEDPVDDVELNRNDVVFSFQDNRNPFIDHPEWVACLFLDECDAACPQDLDGDGLVEAFDLAIVLGSWGPCEGCPTDFNGDGVVDAFDLAQVLGGWGQCQ